VEGPNLFSPLTLTVLLLFRLCRLVGPFPPFPVLIPDNYLSVHSRSSVQRVACIPFSNLGPKVSCFRFPKGIVDEIARFFFPLLLLNIFFLSLDLFSWSCRRSK